MYSILTLLLSSCGHGRALRVVCLTTNSSPLGVALCQLLRAEEDKVGGRVQSLQTVLKVDKDANTEKKLKAFKKKLGEEFCELAQNPVLCLPTSSADAETVWTRLCDENEAFVLPEWDETSLSRILGSRGSQPHRIVSRFHPSAELWLCNFTSSNALVDLIAGDETPALRDGMLALALALNEEQKRDAGRPRDVGLSVRMHNL